MDDVVVVEWTFLPPKYFEIEILVEKESYTLNIREGHAIAYVKQHDFADIETLRNSLHEILISLFLGAQALSHDSFKLSLSSIHKIDSVGNKTVFVFPESCELTMAATSPDIRVVDAKGNVVTDTRRDRIEKKVKLATLSEKYRTNDAALASMLKSISSASNDSHNELIHLYEVRDALCARFGGSNNALNELDIDRSSWDRLHALANNEPLNQGRHRGSKLGQLRQATQDELDEARRITTMLIEAYLEYLDAEQE